MNVEKAELIDVIRRAARGGTRRVKKTVTVTDPQNNTTTETVTEWDEVVPPDPEAARWLKERNIDVGDNNAEEVE